MLAMHHAMSCTAAVSLAKYGEKPSSDASWEWPQGPVTWASPCAVTDEEIRDASEDNLREANPTMRFCLASPKACEHLCGKKRATVAESMVKLITAAPLLATLRGSDPEWLEMQVWESRHSACTSDSPVHSA